MLLAGLVAEDEEDVGEFIGEFRPGDGASLSTAALLWGFLGVVGLGALVAWYRVWWSLRKLGVADELYAKMLRLATLLGFPQRSHQTPYEYASALGRQVPGYERDVDYVARAYVRRRYRGRSVPLPDLREADEAWKRLRWALLWRLFRPASG